MQEKLGRNRGGYAGETIDLAAVMSAARSAAVGAGWVVEDIAGAAGRELPVFKRVVSSPISRLYISTGIHGDEPAGPLAALELLRQNRWPARADVFLLPCLNPSGFPLNRRENAEGVDLNRDYRHPQTAEVRAHVAWLDRQPAFDCTLCLHEDWEANGFYLYELNPENRPSHAARMIAAAAGVCVIDGAAEIEGRPARDGIINPNLDPDSRPQWPEAFYLLQHKTRQSYTLESPSDFPLSVRVAALVAAARVILDP